MVEAEAVLRVSSAVVRVASVHKRATDATCSQRWLIFAPLLPPGGRGRQRFTGFHRSSGFK